MVNKQRKIILISENDELIRAFTRALLFAEGIHLVFQKSMADLSATDRSSHSVLLFDVINKGDFYTIRNEIRFKSKLLNPIAAFCYEPPKSFNAKNDGHHYFFHVPFDLEEVVDNIKKLNPIASQQKLYEYFPAWLKDDDHTIQNWLLTSGKPQEVMTLINDLMNSFNPTNRTRVRGKELLALLQDSLWKENAFQITQGVCDLLECLYTEGTRMRKEILVIDDDESIKEFPLGASLSKMAEDLGFEAKFINPLREQIKPVKDRTAFVFIDIKMNPEKTGQARAIAEKLRKQEISYAILSGYSSRELLNESKKTTANFNYVIEAILKTLKHKRNTVNKSLDGITSSSPKSALNNLIEDVNKAISLFSEYKGGMLSKEEVLKNIGEDFSKSDTGSKVIKDVKELPQNAPYPSKFYGAVRWIVKKEFNEEKTTIKNMIESLATPSDNWCTLYYDVSSKSVTLQRDDIILGTISFSGKNDYWNIMKACIDACPAPCSLSILELDKSFYDGIDKIHDLIQKGTDWRVVTLFDRSGTGSYKLKVKQVLPIETQEQNVKPSIVSREEFDDLKNKVDRILSIIEMNQPR